MATVVPMFSDPTFSTGSMAINKCGRPSRYNINAYASCADSPTGTTVKVTGNGPTTVVSFNKNGASDVPISGDARYGYISDCAGDGGVNSIVYPYSCIFRANMTDKKGKSEGYSPYYHDKDNYVSCAGAGYGEPYIQVCTNMPCCGGSEMGRPIYKSNWSLPIYETNKVKCCGGTEQQDCKPEHCPLCQDGQICGNDTCPQIMSAYCSKPEKFSTLECQNYINSGSKDICWMQQSGNGVPLMPKPSADKTPGKQTQLTCPAVVIRSALWAFFDKYGSNINNAPPKIVDALVSASQLFPGLNNDILELKCPPLADSIKVPSKTKFGKFDIPNINKLCACFVSPSNNPFRQDPECSNLCNFGNATIPKGNITVAGTIQSSGTSSEPVICPPQSLPLPHPPPPLPPGVSIYNAGGQWIDNISSPESMYIFKKKGCDSDTCVIDDFTVEISKSNFGHIDIKSVCGLEGKDGRVGNCYISDIKINQMGETPKFTLENQCNKVFMIDKSSEPWNISLRSSSPNRENFKPIKITPSLPSENKNSKYWLWVIIGVFLIGAVIMVCYFMGKKK